MNLRSLVERKIREARREGKFDNLSGEGAPQDMEENPFADPEMRLAYKVMSNGGFCPPWMELSKEIDEELAGVRRVWENYSLQRRRCIAGVNRSTVHHFAELVVEMDAERDRALSRLETRWKRINRKVDSLNTSAPIDSVRRVPIKLDRERRRFETDFPRLSGASRTS
ncbi:MAG: DUF1992 domain-containing protein [Chloroflexia bacterium]